jgi:hypothetical protein
MYDVAVEDGVLHYGDHCLIKGESLCFTSMLSGEDFFGRIASVRPHEVRPHPTLSIPLRERIE